MKRILGIFMMAALVMGCSDKYEDSDEYKEFMDDLAQAEQDQSELTEQITTLAAAIEALDSRQAALNSVTGVEKVLDDSGDVVGYKISFSGSDAITIYNGTDGEDGADGSDGANGSTGSTGATGAAGAATNLVSVAIEDGVVTITLSGDNTYTFDYGGAPVFNFDGFSGLLYDGAQAIPFSLSSGVTTLYAEIYDELNNVGVDIYTKANLDDITPSSRWSVEIASVTGSETEYTMTLKPIGIDEDIVSGFAKITAVDSDGNKSSQVVEFEYYQIAVTMTMTEVADYTFVSNSVVIITDETISSFNTLKTKLSELSNIILSFPNLKEINETSAFSLCSALKSISLPSATSIGESAFYSCSSLKSISLPSATEIVKEAFNGCTSLASVSLPSATSIGKYAFYRCSALKSVSLPSATSIGDWAFLYCSSLEEISLPKVTSIGSEAFSYCTSLTSLMLATESTLTSVGTNIFKEATTETIDLIIGSSSSAFYDVNNITFGPTGTEYELQSITVQ